MLRLDALELDGDLLAARQIRTQINVPEGPRADLAAEAVLLADAELHRPRLRVRRAALGRFLCLRSAAGRRAPAIEAVRGVAGRRARGWRRGEVGFYALGGQPAVSGHGAKLWLFSASTVCYSTQPNVLQLASIIAAAAAAAAQPGGRARSTRTRRSANEVSLVGEVGLVTRVLFRPLSRRRDALHATISQSAIRTFVVPEAPDAQGSCTQAFEPVQDAAVSWEPIA